MACGGNSPEISNSSQFIHCELCEIVQEATSHCDECLINFCERCAAVHSRLPGKRSHVIENGVCGYRMEFELCPEDGQKMSFFCRTCVVRICPECELTKNLHTDHFVTTLAHHVGKEKEKLLDRLDEVTTKTESISYIPNDIKSMALQIELKWLEHKELIRHEFASLYETIFNCQERLLADMEKEVQQSLAQLEKMEDDHKAVLAASCQLSDECISAIQSLPRQDFLKTYPEFLDSVKVLEDFVDSIPSAKDYMPSFLTMPFSLHKEKVHLHKCLRFESFNFYNLKARNYQHFVPYERIHDVITIGSLIHAPQSKCLPPSTAVRYKIEVCHKTKCKLGQPVWSQSGLKAQDDVFNGLHGLQMLPGLMYVVKICPTFTCTTHHGSQIAEGRTVHIHLVTGEVFDGALAAIKATGSLLFPNIPAFTPQTITKNNISKKKENVLIRRRMLTSKTTSSGHVSRCFTTADVMRLAGFVPTSITDRMPVSEMFIDGRLMCQVRYLKHCSFEEAELLERRLFWSLLQQK